MIHSIELPHSTPEAQGIASSAILAFVDALEEKKLGLHSMMLLRNGSLVAEGWWKPYAADIPHTMFSVSKSFTSTAIGLAVSEGLLSLDDPIISFFPSYITPEIRDSMSALRVRHLLSMSTGHAEDTYLALVRGTDEDWVRTFLSIPITYEPGMHFVYNTGASFMLSAILQSLTGQTLLEYLQPRLFEPLGIDRPSWQSNKRGINLGGTGLSLRTIDMAKFAQLYLQRGLWNGRQIVPEEWVAEATSVHISNGDDPNSDWSQGYGFQFWRCRHHAYRGDGAFGQFCLVMPEQHTVLAMTSGTPDMQEILNAVWEHLLPGMSAEPLAEDPQTARVLKDRLADLAMPRPKTLADEPATSARIANRAIQFEPNALHITAASFTFEKDSCTFTVRDDRDVQHIIPCGRTDWLASETTLSFHEEPAGPIRVAAYGGWTDDHTFVMIWQYIEMQFRHVLSFDFSGNEVDVFAQLDQPFWAERNERLCGRLE